MTVYPLVSETLTVGEMVGTLGRVAGRTIRYVSITDEQWAEVMKERINAHALDHLAHLWQYYRKAGQRYQTTDTLRVVTGRNPETLEEFFRANIESITGGGQ